MQDTIQTLPFLPSDERELFDQVVALLESEGTIVSSEVHALMQPLLDGVMSFAEHRSLLEARLKDIGA